MFQTDKNVKTSAAVASVTRQLANSAPVRAAQTPSGAATWKTRQKITSSLILSNWSHYLKTWPHPQNRKYYCPRRTKPRPQVTCIENFVMF